MKLALISLCVALALPSITQAFFFGVTLTNAAGVAIAAANPAQTGVIITIGVLGAALAFAAGAIGSQLLFPAEDEDLAVPYHVKRRGRREAGAMDANKVFDTILTDIHQGDMEGCFQRLVCDIAARPNDYKKNAPIVDGLQMVQTRYLSNEASTASRKLLEAVQFGKSAVNVVACEVTYNKCYWSGPQMDSFISKFDDQISIEP